MTAGLSKLGNGKEIYHLKFKLTNFKFEQNLIRGKIVEEYASKMMILQSKH